MNIITKSIASLLAAVAVSTTVLAETFPVFEDTAGSPATRVIKKAAGTAATLPVNAKSSAFINFAVGSAGYSASQVTAARLVLYFPTVTKPGSIGIATGTSAFQEKLTTPSITLDSLPLSSFTAVYVDASLRKSFYILDVTAQVKAWLANPNSEYGFVISSDGLVNCTIGAKEGSGSGYPAVLEVDIAGGSTPGGSFVFNGGNMGIGTSAPTERLQVVGGNIRVGNGAGNTPSLLLSGGSISVPFAGGNTLSSTPLTLGTTRGDIVLNPGTNGNAGGNILLNGGVTTTGRLGVGTSAPGAMLDVLGLGIMQGLELRGAAVSYLDFSGDTAVDYNARIIYGGSNDNRLIFTGAPVAFESRATFTNSSPGGALEVSNGSIGLQIIPGTLFGVDNPNAVTLEMAGNKTLGVWDDFAVSSSAFKPGGGSWASLSDIRLKKNVNELHGALDHMLRLRSVTFEYNEPEKIGELPGVRTGFIAQEVETVFPDWVGTKPDGFKFVSPIGFESLAVQALRELRAEKDAQIASLTAENAALKKQLAENDARDKAIEARLAAIESDRKALTAGSETPAPQPATVEAK